MALEIKLSQKLSQSLLMTPQLQQAIKLLQLGRLEYKEAIEQELLENPVLEEIIEESNQNSDKSNNESGRELNDNEYSTEVTVKESIEAQNDSPVDWSVYEENFNDYSNKTISKNNDSEDRPSLEATVSNPQTLTEHLLSQLRFHELNEIELKIALNVIGNLDRSGFLCTSLDEIAMFCKVSNQEVEKVLNIIQSLEPVGIAARNLPECLLIQLDNMGLSDSLASKIISDHLTQLENRKYDQIAKVQGTSVNQVYDAIKLIQKLEPRPAKDFANETTRYVVPDIYVYKDGEEYVVSLNEEGLPRLRVNPIYLNMLNENNDSDTPNKQYLSERMKSAQWLIKSIHQRQHTIFRVTESIVKFQKDFLDYGIEHLKPLVLKEVADDIGMHESTVSRVTTNKYVHTPQGVFELKFFFTTGIQTGEGNISSSSVKEKIKNLVAQEDPKNPISDQQIVETLQKEGLQIARRTVAKYREGLGILSSSKRKKLF
jgi:RNA polymerase sigma-54 factor